MTNALDGVLERAAREIPPARLATIDTPREASREFFGISDGTTAGRPTLELRARGARIPADRMRTSILDLAGSNKLDKPYLAGAYGQGGSTTFGFTARGSVTVSSADGITGCATYVRFSILDPRKNKNGRYEYLVDARGNVPSFDAAAAQFERGTLVRQFDYELPRYGVALSTSDGLLGLANAALFDPVLPKQLRDERKRRREPRYEREKATAPQ